MLVDATLFDLVSYGQTRNPGVYPGCPLTATDSSGVCGGSQVLFPSTVDGISDRSNVPPVRDRSGHTRTFRAAKRLDRVARQND